MNAVLDVAWSGLIYVLLPVGLGALIALPFWLKRRVILGNALGSAAIALVMLIFIIVLFARSFDTIAQGQPNDILLPLGVLVFLGWLDVLILFFLSGAVENRVKKRIINPDDF